MDKALIASYVVEVTLEGIPCEVSLLDKDGNEVGFWAYGAFNPTLPFYARAPTIYALRDILKGIPETKRV